MRMGEEESDRFYKLLWALYFYTNQKYPVIKDLKRPNLIDEEPADVIKINEEFTSHPELIDSFVAKNPFNFSPEELETIKSWKKLINGKFIITAYLKECTVFLSADEEQKAYSVIGLYDEIEDILPPFLPQFVETTLLPYKGKITYYGFINTYPVRLGANIRGSIQEEYQKAKRKFGLIRSLDQPVKEKTDYDEELLRYYLKSVNRRFESEDEIMEILERNPSLWDIYSLELGKSYAKEARKRLNQHGVSSAWFAVFEDVIIASGKTKAEAFERAQEVVPRDKKPGIHVFKYARKVVK